MTEMQSTAIFFVVIFYSSFLQITEECEVLTIPAVGQVALIGELYDARTEQFSGASIFHTPVPGVQPHASFDVQNLNDEDCLNEPPEISPVQIKDKPSSDIEFKFSKSYRDKFDNLDINAAFELSIMSGKYSVAASGEYANNEAESFQTETSSIHYAITTKKQNINFYHNTLYKNINSYYSRPAINNNTFATHVVAGVLWGATVIISCNYDKTSTLNSTTIKAALTFAVKESIFNVSLNVSGEYGDSEKETVLNLTVDVNGDVLPRDGKIPTTFAKAIELMKSVPDLIKNVNSGWGVPLYYELHPLSSLPKKIEGTPEEDILATLEDAALSEILTIYGDLSDTKRKLFDLNQLISKHRHLVRPEDREAISDYFDKIVLHEVIIRSDVSLMLTKFKNNELDISEMYQYIEKFVNSDISPISVRKQLDDWARIQYKIDLAHEFTNLKLNSKTVDYLGLGSSIDEEIVFWPVSYALFFSEETMRLNETRWGNNKITFLEKFEELQEDPTTTFFAVDCDLQVCDVLMDSTYLRKYQADKLVIPDVITSSEHIDDCDITLGFVEEWATVYARLVELKDYYDGNETTRSSSKLQGRSNKYGHSIAIGVPVISTSETYQNSDNAQDQIIYDNFNVSIGNRLNVTDG